MNLQQLQEEYQGCQKCPLLVGNRTQVVFGSGSPNVKIILLGEAPGASEDKLGVPFCGQSGKVLDILLQAAGLSRNEIFITNTILCRPPNNRAPVSEEINNCHPRLETLLAIMQPRIIVTIGNFATQCILGKTGIKALHGKIFEHNGMKVVPVIHPANYLYSGRNPQLLEEMKQDFKVIAKVVADSQKQKTLGE